MPQVELNKTVPDFSAAATSELTISLSDFKGKKHVILYFYPKDDTSGCTTEGQNFRDSILLFDEADAVILGVSRDSIKKHENFKAKQNFPFELLSDPEETLCNLFDVIKEKQLYGKKYMGIERSTFLINKQGELAAEWRKVKVKGHVDEVLQATQTLNS